MFLPLLSACRPDPVQQEPQSPVHLEQEGSTPRAERAEFVVFQQVTQTDVLIVLDTSPGMEPCWARAADGSAELLQHLLGKGHFIHLGVLTTDSADIEVVTSEDLVQALTDHVPQGQQGVRDTIAAAWTEPANADFFRPGVDLDILVPTSTASCPPTRPRFASWSRPPAACRRTWSAEYGDFLSELGMTIEQDGLLDHVELPSVLEPDSVSVSMDGYPWMGQFALSADGHTLYLLDPPPPGYEIRVDYLAAVTPPG